MENNNGSKKKNEATKMDIAKNETKNETKNRNEKKRSREKDCYEE